MTALLDPSHADALRAKFDAELEPVSIRLDVHAAACAECERAVEIATELSALSPKLGVELRDAEGALPVIEIQGAARGRVAFVGLPTGHEFPTFIDALFDVASGATETSSSAKKRLDALSEPIHLRVFTTPT